MLTYTSSRNLFGTLTNNSSTANLAVGDTLINAAIREVLRSRNWHFLNKTDSTLTTTASTQFYRLPYDLAQVLTVTVAIGSFVYQPREAPSREFWQALNKTTYTSTYPEYYYVYDGQIGLWPTPSSTGNTVTIYYKRTVKDLSIGDYSTGSVVSVSNGGTAVVGSGTSWTAKMAGRYIRITDSDTANTGDGFWYEIASVSSSTALTLVRPYGGTSISAGTAAYVIGQASLIPEDYQDLPVHKAVQVYFTSIQPEPARAKVYSDLYNQGYSEMVSQEAAPTISPVIDEGFGVPPNPNLYPSSLT